MSVKSGRRGAIAGVFVVVLLSLAPSAAHAGGKMFSAVDAERQTAFLREMKVADVAARRGDRNTAKKALRRALLAGGFTTTAFLGGTPACGLPAFDIPGWLLTVQGAIGDSAGAWFAARNQGGAYQTLNALHAVALAQLGRDPERRAKYIFREAVPAANPKNTLDPFDYREHDFSILKKLHVAPDPKAAAETLRYATPFAVAADRVEEISRRKSGFYTFLPANPSLWSLAERQAEAGDNDGLQRTLTLLPTPGSHAAALFNAGTHLRERDGVRAAALERRALDALTALHDPAERAGVLCVIASGRSARNDLRGARQALTQATDAAQNIADLRSRYDSLTMLVEYWSLRSPETGFDRDRSGPEGKAARTKILRQMREMVGKISAAPNPHDARPLRPFWPTEELIRIADAFLEKAHNLPEARQTLALARTMALRKGDQTDYIDRYVKSFDWRVASAGKSPPR